MGDKVHTLVIKVDLNCCRCRKGIQDYLCRIQCREHILQITYDEKKNEVLVSGPFNPEELKRKLFCKLPKIIKCIEIKEPPPKDKCKETYMKNCEEEYKEISKCIEKCKKECEDKFTRKSKCACECNCTRKCQFACKCKCKKNKEPQQQKPPNYRCCASPCPCFVPWCNNYQCCSCGVVGLPGWCESGLDGGHGDCEPNAPCPQWSCEPNAPCPQWTCEPNAPCPQRSCKPNAPCAQQSCKSCGKPTAIIIQSEASACSIM